MWSLFVVFFDAISAIDTPELSGRWKPAVTYCWSEHFTKEEIAAESTVEIWDDTGTCEWRTGSEGGTIRVDSKEVREDGVVVYQATHTGGPLAGIEMTRYGHNIESNNTIHYWHADDVYEYWKREDAVEECTYVCASLFNDFGCDGSIRHFLFALIAAYII